MSIANQYQPAQNGIAARAIAAQQAVSGLPALVQRAANQLASATSAAQILEARLSADIAYDEAKKLSRMAQALAAHDELVAKVHEAQGEALKIKSEASRLYYEETQAAIERGEIPGRGGNRGNQYTGGKVEDVNFANSSQHKQINHEGKIIADAEKADPGVVQRTIDDRIAAGEEPTKAALREAVIEAAKQGLRGGGQSTSNKNPIYEAPTEAGKAWSHIYGTCRAFAEWATPENLQLAVSGRHERRDDQSRNIAAVQRAVAALADFERMLDAQ